MWMKSTTAKRALAEKGALNSTEIAKLAGITPRTVHRALNENHTVTARTARKIAKAAGMKTSDLVSFEGPEGATADNRRILTPDEIERELLQPIAPASIEDFAITPDEIEQALASQ